MTRLLLFQVGWFACILGAARGLAIIGVLFAAAWIVWHLTTVRRAGRELAFILLAAALGLALDSVMLSAGFLHVEPPARLAPSWLAALWAQFAVAVGGLALFRGRLLLAGGAGAVGGPLAYLAGERLGAVRLGEGGLVATIVEWGIAFPLVIAARGRIVEREED